MMKLAAVIVETRLIPCMVNVIQAHLDFLPENTSVFIQCGLANFDVLSKSFPNANVELCGVNSIGDYNQLLTWHNFWYQFLDYDRVLVFQIDSFLLKQGIEAFYEWDYIGAPWKFEPFVGNGGLSLRNPEIMHEICLKISPQRQNEDIIITNFMVNNKMGKLAPLEIAEKFSVETIFKLGTLGGHAIEKWLNLEQCKQIKKQYESDTK